MERAAFSVQYGSSCQGLGTEDGEGCFFSAVWVQLPWPWKGGWRGLLFQCSMNPVAKALERKMEGLLFQRSMGPVAKALGQARATKKTSWTSIQEADFFGYPSVAECPDQSPEAAYPPACARTTAAHPQTAGSKNPGSKTPSSPGGTHRREELVPVYVPDALLPRI